MRAIVQQTDEANNNVLYTQVTKSKFQVFHCEKLLKKKTMDMLVDLIESFHVVYLVKDSTSFRVHVYWYNLSI